MYLHPSTFALPPLLLNGFLQHLKIGGGIEMAYGTEDRQTAALSTVTLHHREQKSL